MTATEKVVRERIVTFLAKFRVREHGGERVGVEGLYREPGDVNLARELAQLLGSATDRYTGQPLRAAEHVEGLMRETAVLAFVRELELLIFDCMGRTAVAERKTEP